ncbi:hypothetical protein BRD00_02675 [Halobacteriales archaeon QS_8_69_26]|nr:MAG: hypothetical protein BRD00_02675 [Halobacteriales archaeon QS_8_69_26]
MADDRDATTVLFVATDRDRVVTSARRTEDEADGMEVAGATCTEGVREALETTDVDCVVFGENPLTAEGAQLLDVTDLCETHGDEGPVPVVLFTDGSYGPATAKATDGVADYVRADAEDAHAHLVDRIQWATTPSEDEEAEWYETLVESMEDGVLVFDGSGRIRYGNSAMTDVLGVELDLEGVPLGSLAGEPATVDGVDAIEGAVESVVAGEAEAPEVEVTVDPPGAEPRVVEFQVVGLPGGRDGALATVRNVTEYKQTESALRETRTKIERLHAVTGEMAACRSERELFELAVDAADRVLDADVCGIDVVEDETFGGVDIDEGGTFVPRVTSGEEYGPSSVEGVAGRAFRTGESVLVEDASDRTDASPVAEAGSVLVAPVENAGVLRAVAHEPGAFEERDRDLAELLVAHVGECLTRIRVGETLRERERDLVEERERLVSLFENVPSPLASYAFEDGRPVIRDANPSFEAIFGVDADDVVGDPLHDHVRPPSDDPADVADREDVVDLAGLDAELREGGHLETAVRRDTVEGPLDFLLHAGPLVDAETGEEGYVIYTDISRQKDRQRELQRQGEQLEALADVAAGDMRDWLNEARAYLELAEETGDEADLASVRHAHERMARLVDDLETLVDGETDLDPEPITLETAATRAWARVETGAVNLDVDDGSVEADPRSLEDLLQQLIRNAVDHGTPELVDPVSEGLEADTELAVRIGPLRDREGFYVEDTGVGIPPGERDRVFDPGYSTDEDAAGLGLGVVKEVVDRHGWSVRLRESRSGGARFEFVTDPKLRAIPRATEHTTVPEE